MDLPGRVVELRRRRRRLRRGGHGRSIGKIDAKSDEAASSYVVVATGFWIFGKKRLNPAGARLGGEAQGEHVVGDAEVAAAIERLLSERLAVTDIVHLTGLDPATVRRLRQRWTDIDVTDDARSTGVGTTAEGAYAEVA